MTPKEKAKQLIISYTRNKHLQFGLNDFLGKQCALIAVDEILSSIIKINKYDFGTLNYYWQEVKQEIEKL